MPHLVEVSADGAPAGGLASECVGAALTVAFAPGEAIEDLREAGKGRVELCPPHSLSSEDCYFLMPDDIGTEIIDIMADSDHQLMAEAMRDSLVAFGQVSGSGPVVLDVEQAMQAQQVLASGLVHAATVPLSGGEDPVKRVNTLEHVQVTMLSTLLDDDGLEKMLKRREYLGVSWKPPRDMEALQSLDPTYAWSRADGQGSLSIEVALFVEDEELTVLLRPARIIA